MKRDGLSARLRRAGINQKDLAARLGVTVGSCHVGLQGEGKWHYRAIVSLLELLPLEQRQRWIFERGEDAESD